MPELTFNQYIRHLADSIVRSIRFLLSGNTSGIIAVLYSSIMALPMPFAAVHLLFINLLTDSLPAISIGMEKSNRDLLKDKPRGKNESILNSDYPMPIAETASTFCETIIKKAAIKDVKHKEALAILEAEICDCTQVIVDIYSRFLFEKSVFEARKESALTVEQISQGQLNFDGLEPSTTYTVALMRGTYVRALTTFTTAKGIPSGYTRVVVTNKEEWNTAISSNTGKVAMLIPSGTTLDITSATAIIPNTITSLLIWGADESEEKAAIQPDIRLKGLSFADGGGYETIEFYNLYLHHDNNENNFVVYHQNNKATIQNLILESCKVDKIRGIFRFKNATGSCSNCIINNCLIENIGSYGLFATAEAKGTWTFDNVVLTNSPINESGIDLSQKGPLLKTQQDHSISFEINQCTIYGLAYTIINSGSKPLTLNISNTLFGGFQSGQTVKGYEEGTTVNSSENVYTASDSPFHSNALGECLTITSAELFNAPAAANGDFTVKIDTYKTYGDQRWNK